MKRKNKKNKYLIPVLLVGALLLGGSLMIAQAGLGFWDKVAEITGSELAARFDIPQAEEQLGAFPGTDVYEQMHFKGGMIKNASFYAPLNWSAGTTTAAAGETTVVTVAKLTNDTGKELLCRDVWLDVSTARGIWGGDLTTGTTTASGDVSLTSTSTASLIASQSVTTTTVDIYNKEDDEGTNDQVYWRFPANSILTVADTFDTANATSAASFTAEGGFTGVGAVGAECWYK
ncbi:hypothetical protein H8E77_37855 [bacterium]|nr:hypothetical protein [bacterium]